MKIERIVSPMFATNCYLITDNGEAALIDCGEDAELILQAIEKAGQPLTKIIFTHGHFDHIMSANEIQAKTGAKIYVSLEDSECLSDTEKSLAKRFGVTHDKINYDFILEDEIEICKNVFSVIKTPGHSKGSVSLLCGDVLFSGDTLFCGTIGRYEKEDEQTIKESLKKLLSLPESVKVYPGHDRLTTIGQERLFNPYADFEKWN